MSSFGFRPCGIYFSQVAPSPSFPFFVADSIRQWKRELLLSPPPLRRFFPKLLPNSPKTPTPPWLPVSTAATSVLDFNTPLPQKRKFRQKSQSGKGNCGPWPRARNSPSFLNISAPTKITTISMESEFSTPSSQAKISEPKPNPPSSGTNLPINPSSAFPVATFCQLNNHQMLLAPPIPSKSSIQPTALQHFPWASRPKSMMTFLHSWECGNIASPMLFYHFLILFPDVP